MKFVDMGGETFNVTVGGVRLGLVWRQPDGWHASLPGGAHVHPGNGGAAYPDRTSAARALMEV